VRDRIAQHSGAMNAEQLADILGVSEITIYKHAKAGKIPSFRIGTCVRFCPKTVADWIARQ
jgi:excisionase family DNA binding protein